jgi:PAS domain S-box-containing protein
VRRTGGDGPSEVGSVWTPAGRAASRRYAFAIGIVFLGWAVREALTPALGPTALPFITFFPVVAAAAWYGGLGPALLSLGLSALASHFFFVEPTDGLRLIDRVAFLAFPLAAGFIVAAIELMHRARYTLASERRLLATTLASIGDGVITTDSDGRVTFLNPVAGRLTGWTLESAAGRPLAEVFRVLDETSREPVENPALRAMREGKILGPANHSVLVAKGGQEVPIDDSAAPIRDAQDGIIGAVLVFRDVGPRRRAEQNVQHALERTRSVVDHVVDGIVSIDEAGRIASFNRAAERLFGYAASEVIGRNVNLLMPEPYHSEHDGYLRNYAETGRAQIIGIGREVVGRRKDGSVFPMDLAVSEFRMGEQKHFTGIIRDITERKRFEAELRSRIDELAEVNRRKSEFLAMLAHELRNPLAPIRNSITLLQLKGPPDPELAAARSVIERQVGQMSRLLDDLLDVNRLGRHRLELSRERVTLAAVVERAVETARPAVAHGQHQLEVELPAREIVLEADPIRLAQVFANLLTNASKYTDPGGRIALKSVREGSDVVVSVEDNGIGIEPEVLPRLFQMFAQVPMALERAQGGVGIGLWLAKGLVELHGGSLSARSDGLGKGSVFTVRLPVVLGASVPSIRTPMPVTPGSVSRRILIADDLPDNGDTLAAMLRAIGHEVHVVYDGESAVRAAAELGPEVVLLDIGMPGLNGYEACRRIRAEPWGRAMYLIAQTGWGQEEDRLRSKAAGFDRHMLKPVDCGELVVALAGIPGREVEGSQM